jgi:hypothetical protein
MTRRAPKFITSGDDAQPPKADHRSMMTSPHTHVALNYVREQELRQAVSHPHSVADTRYVSEEAPTVGRLRRRLAQMHLASASA